MTYKGFLLIIFALAKYSRAQCPSLLAQTFVRWSGLSPENVAPVFVYSASGEEESLTGACLAQCRELPDCAAVLVAYSKGNCQGVAYINNTRFQTDSSVVYFKKICTKLPNNCDKRWWALENTPGYYFNSEGPTKKVIVNTTVQECYESMLSSNEIVFRSAQWIDLNKPSDSFTISDTTTGNCILNGENKVTEPESYRVSNYYTLYIENQCNHDYSNRIDRCSYEEYNNQTLKHVDVTYNNITRIDCKSACEKEQRFVCRGFSWTLRDSRGICDLHSEDLVSTGSWLLRRVPLATYYRRVVCLNISVECGGSDLVVTYYPRGVFRGRIYVPGRGDRCSSRAPGAGPVRVSLPLYGDCDVNFAYAISKGPHGIVNRIDRCSYEEYNNQTLKHVDVTYNNITRIDCKSACEKEQRFVCRGFSWTLRDSRGICDLHSEDLVSTGSWLLRRVPLATYYRRVVCLNISVECGGSDLVVTYYPRGVFRGRIYVPGRGDRCSSRAPGAGPVRVSLPLYGDCDVNFAYAISKGPHGIVNRTMAYVMLMIQNNPIIQASGDRWVRAGCSPGAGAHPYTKVDASVSVQDAGRPSLGSGSSTGDQSPGASAVYESGPAPLAMYVVRAHGDTSTAAVSLGELLELRIETIGTKDDAEIEAYHLVASSRLGDSSVLLLDSRGCPTGQVDFPAFTWTYVDGMQRLSARFKAFRFPTSHIVRFVLMVRFCDKKCIPVTCGFGEQLRNARNANGPYHWSTEELVATVTQVPRTAAEASRMECGRVGRAPLELELVVGSRNILSAETLVRADQRSSILEEDKTSDDAVVCLHELLLVALVLAWLTVQILLLLGCCVLVKRYRNLAAMNMQKDYHSFDNVGFDTTSTHRRVHWPDQNIDIIHGN